MKDKRNPKAHWHIRSEHASKEMMSCTTCHNQDKVWLFNFGREVVDANHAPKLCLQCHYRQEKDWEIGAHGKRASGWQYEKAVYNCVYCHDPHKPAFEKQWPVVAPYRSITYQ